MHSQTFYSNGKLLLTGEYLVIDGAKALAIPTQKGQSLTVSETIKGSHLIWKSWTHDKQCWLEVSFSLPELTVKSSSDDEKANWLRELLLSVKYLNPSFLSNNKATEVNTNLGFPRNWGLGSSSTLINNVAQWAQVDPFALHFKISNGSGYDIACAKESSPIIYSTNNGIQSIEKTTLNKSFLDKVFFIHLNKKQNSFEAVTSYNDLKNEINLKNCIQSLDKITNQFIQARTLQNWENAMNNHEYLISNILQQETVKEKLFPMYPNSIKSLGAWGGDFIMATGTKDDADYFKKRGYETVTFFDEMKLRATH